MNTNYKINAKFGILKIVTFFLIGWLNTTSIYAVNSCLSLFNSQTNKNNKIFHNKVFAEAALKIMMEGSLNVSRTKVLGRRYMAPLKVKDDSIAVIAEVNFEKAARFVIKNFDSLEINLETAVVLNKILTKGLVPEDKWGQYDYRVHGSYVNQIDPNIGYRPRDFYITWLNSPSAKSLHETSPIEFAEIIHNTVMSLDSFPDGNGRLSRLFADLALIKKNISPAYYTSMKDYFERGNSRSQVSRDMRKLYFHEIVTRGMALMGIGFEELSKLFNQISEKFSFAS